MLISSGTKSSCTAGGVMEDGLGLVIGIPPIEVCDLGCLSEENREFNGIEVREEVLDEGRGS